jgi:DNA polymerase III subunit delta
VLPYQAALKKITDCKFDPVYLLFGEERYLQEEFTSQLALSFLGSGSAFGLEKLDGNALSLREIISRLDEPELFSPNRLLVVDSPPYLAPPRKSAGKGSSETEEAENDGGMTEADIIEDYLGRINPGSPESILIFRTPKVDRRKRFFKQVDKKGIAVECSPLKGEALADWIREKASRLGKKIDRAALDRLMLAGEQNLHYFSNELEKYALYLGEAENVITLTVVEELFSGDIQGDVFKLSDALSEGALDRALGLLGLLQRRREKPLLIFFMLTRHYRLLLQAQSFLDQGLSATELTAALEVHPFVARKLREQAASYSRFMLEEIIILLQRTDLQLKTGRTEPFEALKLLLSRIGFLQEASRSSLIK